MDYSDRTASSRSSSERSGKVWDETRQRTEEMIDSGEECVRENPSSAVLIAFIGGAIIGALAGWNIAESRHERRHHSLRSMFRDLQKRMEF